MPSVSFGAAENNSSWIGNPYSDGIALPVGRAAANGSQACLITGLGLYATGAGSTITGRFYLGPAYTPVIARANGSGEFSGLIGMENEWLVAGGSTRVQAAFNAPVRYYRGGGGSTVGDGGVVRAGTMAGVYTYAMAPSEPTVLGATDITPTTVTTNFTWQGDDGGAGVNGFRLQFTDDPNFVNNVRVIDTATGQNGVDGLTPGTYYYYRVAAKNRVTDLQGTVGPWSLPATLRTLSGAYVGNGSSFATAEVYVGNGSAWVPALTYVGDGANWNPAL